MIIISAEESRQRKATALLERLAREAMTDDPDILIARVVNASAEKHLARFITDDAGMKEMKADVRRLVSLPDPVLITGPSGTGKELIAHALHANKDPADFYAINMAGLPEGLIESELFGHRKGAFTGATIDHPGIFKSAGDGTVFLDEIGEAPMNLQAKLLRALQPDENGRRFVRAVGSAAVEEIHCRIIAATKVNLYQAVREGKFREDLYGRLMTFEVVISPLSQRPADKLPILRSLGCDDLSEIDDSYWVERIEMFNVRALQAYARRKAIGL